MKVKLIDVCDFQGGSQPPKNEWKSHYEAGYIRMLQIRDFTQTRVIEPEYVRITDTIKTCKSDDILIARYGASLGKILSGLEGAYNVAIMKTLPNENRITKPYLKYFLMSEYFQTFILNVGSRAAQAGFNKEELSVVEIPLPPLETQKQIAATLDKVTDLINKRKQQLEKLEELVKSRFVEMFGDVRTNSKGFKAKKGVELFKISNGKAVPNDKRFENGIPAYGGNGISWYTDDVLYEQDTIVIGRVGFQSGNVHLVKGPIWITDNAMYISEFYDDSLSLVFLCEMMEQIDFTKQQDAGDLKKVTQKPFMEMKYILPPKNLQSNYIAFVSQTDKSKQQIQQSLEKLETLKKSLMQEYFG